MSLKNPSIIKGGRSRKCYLSLDLETELREGLLSKNTSGMVGIENYEDKERI